MNIRRMPAVLLGAVLLLTLAGRAGAESTKIEIRGDAILKHACGKVALQHMELIHAGKFDEATRLGTPEMQTQWKALPADDRAKMSEMMKELSVSKEQLSADIRTGGTLAIDGKNGTLTVTQKKKDANGSSTSTLTQHYALDGTTCRISR
jgi:hypothetical protein